MKYEPEPVGTPLAPPRMCQGCHQLHPTGTTCAGGVWPWEPVVPVAVMLTADEMAAARAHAIEAVAAGQRNQYTNKFRPEDAGFKNQTEAKTMGYAGEMAGARATGLSGPHWEVLGAGYRTKDKNRDIGDRTDVKTTGSPTGFLWVRKGDKPGYLYLLVTGTGPAFTVHGWLEGPEAMLPKWWVEEKPNPAWKIPQWRLRPLPMPKGA